MFSVKVAVPNRYILYLTVQLVKYEHIYFSYRTMMTIYFHHLTNRLHLFLPMGFFSPSTCAQASFITFIRLYVILEG